MDLEKHSALDPNPAKDQPCAVSRCPHHRHHGSRQIVVIALISLLLLLLGGCGVYFNTFFNAKKSFGSAEKSRKKSVAGLSGQNDYKIAIEKSLKVIENHTGSKYYDDALYILAASYFHSKQYAKAERRFSELIANYPENDRIRESELYLAKSKLELGDIGDAMALFGAIFDSESDRDYKAEAAMALSEYYFEEKNFEDAQSYLLAVRDSLGSEGQKRLAQKMIAEGYISTYRFNDGLKACIQLLGMTPDKDMEYFALFNAAECAYRLQRVKDGQAYLSKLMDNQLYFDSLSYLQLKVAEGYEIEEDLELAEATYQTVVEKSENPLALAEAYYRLGLTYQYDYDKLTDAKEYYDKAVKAQASSEPGRAALQHSSDIGKLERYSKARTLDTSATEEAINEVAQTQFLLAELFWFQLNKPDSAMAELRYLIDSFPTSESAPAAMISLAQMYRDHTLDTTSSDSVLRLMLATYPRSDDAPYALELLNLLGSPADTGYASHYILKAEYFIVDDFNLDSARAYYGQVIERFPDSKHATQARFNLIWLTEQYEHPGDSSLVFAYQEFLDSFPRSPMALDVQRWMGGLGRSAGRDRPIADRNNDDRQSPADTLRTDGVDLPPEDSIFTDRDRDDEVLDYGEQQFVNIYISPDKDTIILLNSQPVKIDKAFEFPADAYSIQQDEFRLYFQVLLDFTGKVLNHILKVPTINDELNDRASITVASMTFDPVKVSQQVFSVSVPKSSDDLGHWFVYEYRVKRPDFLK
ncbi:MAG: tetratricopeptide repeat protein [candidate division Zixibacteria bacterium]|nr:tetratricopeptide repeat protein [candidate division Zixibacteria bacterium]